MKITHPRKYKTNTQLMKTFYILFFSVAFCLSTTTSDAQTSQMPNKAAMKKDTANTFLSFSPVALEGKVYVRWMVKNDRKDGLFVVERSEDGLSFEALGFKDRIGSQMDVNLFYSYIDESPIAGYGHYRILQVGQDNTYRYSDVVKVKSDIKQENGSGNAAIESK